MKLVLYKIKNPTPSLSHLLVFDEAQSQIWSRYLEMRGRQSYMATLATQARAFGLGILVLCQEPAMKLMREITANSCIKVALHLGDGDEVQGFGRSMGLKYEQMDAMYHFDRGDAICRVGIGYTEPIRLELYDFQDGPVTDDELAELMKSQWDRLLEGIEPAITEETIRPGGVNATRKTSGKESLGQDSAENEQKEDQGKLHDGVDKTATAAELSPDEEIYLRAVKAFPWRLVGELQSLLTNENIAGTERLSKNRAVNNRKKLLTKGYLESFNVTGTGRSGRSQCDLITDKANMGKTPHPRGGLSHSFWVYRISEYFRKENGKVEIGSTATGNEIDASIMTSDGKRVGVEVVISGLVVDNVKKFISEGYFHRILILAIDGMKKKEVERLLRDDISMRIEIGLLKDYFISL